MDIGKIEYRVRPVTRYIITRYAERDNGEPLTKGSVGGKGEYENADVAYEVAYALCKAEHERLGLPPGDERIQYPRHPDETGQIATGSSTYAVPDQLVAGRLG